MSGELRVNNITDEAGTGSPDFPNGVDAGVLTGTLPAIDGSNLTGDIPADRITDALNATGSAPIYACRAWVNFDGTGTVSIRESGNVSSITDNGTGDYTINFTTAMEDASYAGGGSASSGANDDGDANTMLNCRNFSTSSSRVTTYAPQLVFVNRTEVQVFYFR